MTELPEGWSQKRFGDVFKVKYGKAIQESLRFDNAEFPVVGSAGIMTYTKTPLVREPTVVIGRKGNVGSIQIFKDGCYPIDTTYYMPSSAEFDIDFLTHLLTSLELVKLDSSTATPSLRREDLENVQVVIPPIQEQYNIVELLEDHLSHLDSALADVKQAKIKAAQFRRSLLQAAFTGNLDAIGTRLTTELPSGWSYESINSIVEGGMISDGDWVESKDQDPNGDVRLTQLADVGDGEFRSRSDRWMNDEQASRLNVNYLQPGDLLMARMPDPLGRTCIVPENVGRAVTVVDVAIIRIARKDVNPKFVMWLLNSPGIRQQIEMLASGTTRRRITRKNLGTIDLPIPPIDGQNKIVDLLEDHLSRLDASISLANSMEKQSIGLRRSLLQAAFTGQLIKEVLSV